MYRYTYKHTHTHLYIYIYIYRERERETQKLVLKGGNTTWLLCRMYCTLWAKISKSWQDLEA